FICTMNLREWRHFFKLRTAPAAHPDMRAVACPLYEKFRELLPVFFE
ncbi:MAG: FAD-dependent thymidylate synthase, partial [Clostridia bacterium]|nr:FAD-dependent thymidylate synthase [Clostridia bacterium]